MTLDKVLEKAYLNEQRWQICLADSPSIHLITNSIDCVLKTVTIPYIKTQNSRKGGF